MDPLTALLISTLMSLLNGAVMGFMHRDLPPSMRPSAMAWRVGTLLLAFGCLVLGAQAFLPPLGLALGNGLVMVGLAQYLLALRLFRGLPSAAWLYAPAVIGTVGIAFFAAVYPHLPTRVVIASVVWVFTLLASSRALRGAETEYRSVSPRVMRAILITIAFIMFARALYFAFGPGKEQTILEPGSWVNVATPMLAAVLPIIGTTTFLLMTSERLRRNWEQAASTDQLTGLSNRRTLTDSGTARVTAARTSNEPIALAIIDVDHFKSINDRFGHEVGDLALKHVAARLRVGCRTGDLLSRHGGEEFVVLFGGVSADTAQAAGERLREAIASSVFVSGDLQLNITVSVGVAALMSTDQQLDDLLRRADQALYRAKHSGRNRVVVSTKDEPQAPRASAPTPLVSRESAAP